MSGLAQFGPAGNSERFYEEGHSRTVESFAWQKPLGLSVFEYPFGRGINLSVQAAQDIGAAARAAGVAISAHAPYYINLGSAEQETRQKGQDYILRSARMLDLMGGERLVLHVGAPQKNPREEAFQRCCEGLIAARAALVAEGLSHIRLCPETMGRPSVIGTLDEVLQMVKLDDSFIPCIDFAHLHAAQGGILKGPDDFEQVLEAMAQTLGNARASSFHSHFSHIEYGPKGELKHRIFADEGFGPDFAHLAPLLVRRGWAPTFICESRGTMADDAAQMLRIYQQALSAQQQAH